MKPAWFLLALACLGCAHVPYDDMTRPGEMAPRNVLRKIPKRAAVSIHAPSKRVLDESVGLMTAAGYRVASATDYNVVFQIKATTAAQFWGDVLLGPQQGEAFINVTLTAFEAPPDSTKVFADAVLNRGNRGFISLDQPKHTKGLQDILEAIRARAEH